MSVANELLICLQFLFECVVNCDWLRPMEGWMDGGAEFVAAIMVTFLY